MMFIRTLVFILTLGILTGDCYGWNALGHKVVAEICWQQLTDEQRREVVDVLRRHPRFDEDFVKRMDGQSEQEIFQQAGVWPDLARNFAGEDRRTYHQSTWHYINLPVFVGPEFPLRSVNLETTPSGDSENWNGVQALKYCQQVWQSDASPAQRALALCWISHIVGDLHQPLHSVALFSERFPDGDKGGNSIPTVQGNNLHSLWDNFLGRSHRLNNVRRSVYDLSQEREFWEVDAEAPVKDWIEESRQLAESFVYSPEIRRAVAGRGELEKIELSEEYLKEAGQHARGRVVAAGLRLAVVLGAEDVGAPEGAAIFEESVRERRSDEDNGDSEKLYWLNTRGNVRHNPSCEWFENTSRGRFCTKDEGKPCGICGG